ncbi:LPS biosynthesis protein [Bacteroidia bacterium]|nr:LPS biosynthesis protein [Bacteroidia bacterium]
MTNKVNKTVVYVGNFLFPDGNAAGQRVVSNGKILKGIGYTPIFIGLSSDTKITNANLLDTESIYDGMKSYCISSPRGIKDWLAYKYQFKKISRFLESLENLQIVIMYGAPTISLFGSLLRKWCLKNNVLLVADVVDWLSASVGNLPYRIAKYFDTVYQKVYLNSRVDGVITASEYLNEYYRRRGCQTVIIPPLTDCNSLVPMINSKAKISLVYVGIPFAINGKKVKYDSYKDRLDKVVECLGLLLEKGIDFEFNIYGLTEQQYLLVVDKHQSILEKLRQNVFFNGSISHNEAVKKIAEADFSIFFRDVNKVTLAGFPTKFIESISCGTPVITTKTSDLQNYLIEGKNGFFIDIDDKNKMIEQMKNILSLDKDEILRMKKYSFDSKLFYYNNYTDRMKIFLTSIKLYAH